MAREDDPIVELAGQGVGDTARGRCLLEGGREPTTARQEHERDHRDDRQVHDQGHEEPVDVAALQRPEERPTLGDRGRDPEDQDVHRDADDPALESIAQRQQRVDLADLLAAPGLPQRHPARHEGGDQPRPEKRMDDLQDSGQVHRGTPPYSASSIPSTGSSISLILPRIRWSMIAAMSALVLRKSLEASRPWPRRVSSNVNHAPVLLTMLMATPTSSRPPSLDTPSPYITSNSATRNGGATLFFTTLTRTRLPTDSVPVLIVSIRRMSRRTLA